MLIFIDGFSRQYFLNNNKYFVKLFAKTVVLCMQAKKDAASYRIEIFLTNNVSLEKKLFDENFCNCIKTNGMSQNLKTIYNITYITN